MFKIGDRVRPRWGATTYGHPVGSPRTYTVTGNFESYARPNDRFITLDDGGLWCYGLDLELVHSSTRTFFGKIPHVV